MADEVNPLDALVEANVFQRLYENRILYLRGAIEETVADTLVAQMMSLDADSDKDVTLYINSPGGLVHGMFAIYDLMQLMNAKVHTVCVGIAASAAAFLLATGTGTRAATPNARIMFHQPHGGARGQAVDIQIHAQQISYLRERQYEILAERTGQVLPLGEWALRRACQQGRTWLDAGLAFGRIAVNVTAPQLARPEFVTQLRHILESADLPARYLELEITESSLMHSDEGTIERLHELRRMGVSLAIDDFGTGSSSLGSLRRFPVDTLQLDHSFVAELGRSKDATQIAQAVIGLAHGLGLKVVAEGVERPNQLRQLVALGCEQAQGNHFTQPLPAHLRQRGAFFRRRHRIDGKFALYGGRIDPGKGCEELIEYFSAYVEDGGDASLVLMGVKLMPLPEEPFIRFAGRLSDQERMQALEAATVVVVPSPYESLSLLALEALSVGTPILANARSAVLVEHCRKSNGGLYYADRDEFVECLKLLVGDARLRQSLGRNGRDYVRRNYRWDVVLGKYERLFAKVRNAR